MFHFMKKSLTCDMPSLELEHIQEVDSDLSLYVLNLEFV